MEGVFEFLWEPCIMDYLMFIVSNQKEESISIQRVKVFFLHI